MSKKSSASGGGKSSGMQGRGAYLYELDEAADWVDALASATAQSTKAITDFTQALGAFLPEVDLTPREGIAVLRQAVLNLGRSRLRDKVSARARRIEDSDVVAMRLECALNIVMEKEAPASGVRVRYDAQYDLLHIEARFHSTSDRFPLSEHVYWTGFMATEEQYPTTAHPARVRHMNVAVETEGYLPMGLLEEFAAAQGPGSRTVLPQLLSELAGELLTRSFKRLVATHPSEAEAIASIQTVI